MFATGGQTLIITQTCMVFVHAGQKSFDDMSTFGYIFLVTLQQTTHTMVDVSYFLLVLFIVLMLTLALVQR